MTEQVQLRKFVVDRKKWLRGEGADDSGLLVRGRMCCLGFVCQQCGIEDWRLIENSMPSPRWDGLPDWLTPSAHDFEGAWDSVLGCLARTNDARDLSGPKRELELQRLAALAGFEFEFIN